MSQFSLDDPLLSVRNSYQKIRNSLLVAKERSLQEISMIMGANRSGFVFVNDSVGNFLYTYSAIDLANSIGLGRELTTRLCDLNGMYDSNFLCEETIASEALKKFERKGVDVLPILRNKRIVGYLEVKTLLELLSYSGPLKIEKEKDDKADSIFSKENMTITLLHDLRTPLMVIQGSCRSARELTKDLPLLARRLELIVAAGNKISTYVDDILDANKARHINDISKQEESVESIVCESIASVSSISNDRNQTLSSNVGEIVAMVDRKLLERCVTNLISNAAKYSGRDSSISVAAEVLESVNSEDLNTLRIIVSDTGAGIDEKLQSSVFDKFFQEEGSNRSSYHKGVGLGLHIANEFAKAHGGKLYLDNDRGSGCHFVLELPDCVTSVADKSGDVSKSNCKSLLVVEDNQDLQQYLSQLLSRNGYEVNVASCGVEALRKIQNSNFDLVLSDINLPNLDGIDLLIGARESQNNLPFVLMTGFLSSYTERLGSVESAGLSSVEKPLNFKNLLGIVESHF